eukprot:SAG11_NODE_39950_length_216_cov_22.888889_1_plen_52_part_01
MVGELEPPKLLLLEGLSTEDITRWDDFYTDCREVEQSAAEIGTTESVNVRMF